MQVILLENISKLGKIGDQVNVKNGFGYDPQGTWTNFMYEKLFSLKTRCFYFSWGLLNRKIPLEGAGYLPNMWENSSVHRACWCTESCRA